MFTIKLNFKPALDVPQESLGNHGEYTWSLEFSPSQLLTLVDSGSVGRLNPAGRFISQWTQSGDMIYENMFEMTLPEFPQAITEYQIQDYSRDALKKGIL